MTRQREIIIVAISMFIVSMAWIGFDLYHNAVTSTISAPLQADIQPIVSNFDTQVIQNLKQRHYSDPIYILSPQQDTTATQSGQLLQTPPASLINSFIGSPSGTPTSTISATP